jgi:hypothetical protein
MLRVVVAVAGSVRGRRSQLGSPEQMLELIGAIIEVLRQATLDVAALIASANDYENAPAELLEEVHAIMRSCRARRLRDGRRARRARGRARLMATQTPAGRGAARDAAIYVNDTLEVAYAIAVDIFVQASPEAVVLIYDRINAEKLRRAQSDDAAED